MKQKFRPLAAFVSLLFIFLAVKCNAQNPPQKVNNWYEYKALSADSGFNPPANFSSPGHFYRRPGSMVYNAADSNWYLWTGSQLLPVKKAQNGLTDSAGRHILGGDLYKLTDISNRGNSLFIHGRVSEASANPLLAIGQGTVNNNGFDFPLVVADSARYVSSNSPFASFNTIDAVASPGAGNANGFMFLNFQDVTDSLQPNMRVINPTRFEPVLGLDLIGRGSARLGSSLCIFTYADNNMNAPTFGNLMSIHNGPFNLGTGKTSFLIDSLNNMLIGPGADTLIFSGTTATFAYPHAHLDILDNSSIVPALQPGLWIHGSTQVAKFDGPVQFPQFTTTNKLAISPKVEGMQVYDITLHQMSYWNGTTWVNF
jgi:hypothetical protein